MLATKTNFCFPTHIQAPCHKDNRFAKNPLTVFFQGYSGRRRKEAQSLVLSQAQAARHVKPHKAPKRREGGQQSSPEKRWEPAGADWGCGLPTSRAADPPIQVGPGTHFHSTGVLARRPTQGQPLSPVLVRCVILLCSIKEEAVKLDLMISSPLGFLKFIPIERVL